MAKNIVMIRVAHPAYVSSKVGPWVSIAGLQRAMQEYGPPWFSVRDPASGDGRGTINPATEIPWFWCWLDIELVRRYRSLNQPMIVGPNFDEREVYRRPQCRLIVTYTWQRAHLDTAGRQDVAICQYPHPIYNVPGAPLPPERTVFVYAKRAGMVERAQALLPQLTSRYSDVPMLIYGKHTRDDLFRLARTSRVCLYLSPYDSGSIVQAETLLAGCATVSIPSAAPWLDAGVNGIFISPELDMAEIAAAIDTAATFDRDSIRHAAMELFSPKRVVTKVTQALEAVRRWC